MMENTTTKDVKIMDQVEGNSPLKKNNMVIRFSNSAVPLVAKNLLVVEDVKS